MFCGAFLRPPILLTLRTAISRHLPLYGGTGDLIWFERSAVLAHFILEKEMRRRGGEIAGVGVLKYFLLCVP